jgi:hypothetical protein
VIRVVKGIIPDRIFYPHPHFLPIFCLNLRRKGMENPRKIHPFYNPAPDSSRSERESAKKLAKK